LGVKSFHEEELLGGDGKCAIFIAPGEVDISDLKTDNIDWNQPHGF
jgi:hypothetical protein